MYLKKKKTAIEAARFLRDKKSMFVKFSFFEHGNRFLVENFAENLK